jgi:phthalate 4,5-dioxygenase
LRNKDNDWLIDRQVQKTGTYTGIEGITTQDHAIQESMGQIVDRSRERLGSTVKAIVAARRLLLEAAETVREGGDPPGIDTGYYAMRCGARAAGRRRLP